VDEDSDEDDIGIVEYLDDDHAVINDVVDVTDYSVVPTIEENERVCQICGHFSNNDGTGRVTCEAAHFSPKFYTDPPEFV
jgi:hypothetical protein